MLRVKLLSDLAADAARGPESPRAGIVTCWNRLGFVWSHLADFAKDRFSPVCAGIGALRRGKESVMELFSSTTVPVLEQVIGFAQSRHEVLAGNVANLDTPGYQVRDLSVSEFRSRLREMLEARDHGRDTLSEGAPIDLEDRAMKRVRETMRDVLHHDGSDVSLESQVLELSKNQSMHNMAIAIMNQQFRLLNVAISERV